MDEKRKGQTPDDLTTTTATLRTDGPSTVKVTVEPVRVKPPSRSYLISIRRGAMDKLLRVVDMPRLDIQPGDLRRFWLVDRDPAGQAEEPAKLTGCGCHCHKGKRCQCGSTGDDYGFNCDCHCHMPGVPCECWPDYRRHAAQAAQPEQEAQAEQGGSSPASFGGINREQANEWRADFEADGLGHTRGIQDLKDVRGETFDQLAERLRVIQGRPKPSKASPTDAAQADKVEKAIRVVKEAWRPESAGPEPCAAPPQRPHEREVKGDDQIKGGESSVGEESNVGPPISEEIHRPSLCPDADRLSDECRDRVRQMRSEALLNRYSVGIRTRSNDFDVTAMWTEITNRMTTTWVRPQDYRASLDSPEPEARIRFPQEGDVGPPIYESPFFGGLSDKGPFSGRALSDLSPWELLVENRRAGDRYGKSLQDESISRDEALEAATACHDELILRMGPHIPASTPGIDRVYEASLVRSHNRVRRGADKPGGASDVGPPISQKSPFLSEMGSNTLLDGYERARTDLHCSTGSLGTIASADETAAYRGEILRRLKKLDTIPAPPPVCDVGPPDSEKPDSISADPSILQQLQAEHAECVRSGVSGPSPVVIEAKGILHLNDCGCEYPSVSICECSQKERENCECEHPWVTNLALTIARLCSVPDGDMGMPQGGPVGWCSLRLEIHPPSVFTGFRERSFPGSEGAPSVSDTPPVVSSAAEPDTGPRPTPPDGLNDHERSEHWRRPDHVPGSAEKALNPGKGGLAVLHGMSVPTLFHAYRSAFGQLLDAVRDSRPTEEVFRSWADLYLEEIERRAVLPESDVDDNEESEATEAKDARPRKLEGLALNLESMSDRGVLRVLKNGILDKDVDWVILSREEAVRRMARSEEPDSDEMEAIHHAVGTCGDYCSLCEAEVAGGNPAPLHPVQVFFSTESLEDLMDRLERAIRHSHDPEAIVAIRKEILRRTAHIGEILQIDGKGQVHWLPAEYQHTEPRQKTETITPDSDKSPPDSEDPASKEEVSPGSEPPGGRESSAERRERLEGLARSAVAMSDRGVMRFFQTAVMDQDVDKMIAARQQALLRMGKERYGPAGAGPIEDPPTEDEPSAGEALGSLGSMIDGARGFARTFVPHGTPEKPDDPSLARMTNHGLLVAITGRCRCDGSADVSDMVEEVYRRCGGAEENGIPPTAVQDGHG